MSWPLYFEWVIENDNRLTLETGRGVYECLVLGLPDHILDMALADAVMIVESGRSRLGSNLVAVGTRPLEGADSRVVSLVYAGSDAEGIEVTYRPHLI